MTDTMGLLVFRGAVDVPKFSKEFDFTINKRNYLERDSKNIVCSCCEKPIKTNNLGAILPGSNIFYCEDPSCLAEYVSGHIEK